MPLLKTYDLFISHAWKSSENSEYYRLERLLGEAAYFEWRNYSVPEHDPLGTKTDRELYQALERQIRPVNCVLLISGMYVNHRKWIQAEIELAKVYSKPIVAVRPWGQERTPIDIQLVAKELVGWNASSVIEAVRRHSL